MIELAPGRIRKQHGHIAWVVITLIQTAVMLIAAIRLQEPLLFAFHLALWIPLTVSICRQINRSINPE